MVMSYLTDHLHWLEKEEGTILLRSNRNRFGNKDGQIQYTRPSFPFSRARERWKDGVWKGVNLSCFMVRTISDKHISRTFQGQITVFKDWNLCNKSAFVNPLFDYPIGKNTSWSRLRFLLLRSTLITLFYSTFRKNYNKMTGYDLRLHLRYRIVFRIKKQK